MLLVQTVDKFTQYFIHLYCNDEEYLKKIKGALNISRVKKFPIISIFYDYQYAYFIEIK